MQVDYTDEMNYASTLIVAAYHETVTNSEEMHIHRKGIRDVVTSIDYGIENYLIADIQRNFPDDQIIAEETYNKTLTNKRTWVIDPIDGTVNFARGFPFFGVQMALLVNQKPVAASIYLPIFDEVYKACLGSGSFLNGKLIEVSEQRPVDESIVTLGDFASDPIVDNSLQIESIKSLVGSVLKIKMFGAACYDFVALTRGLSDIHILLDFRLWDIMPGLLIAREAGVMFRTLKGNHLSASSKNLVGSYNPQLIDFVVSQFKSVG